MCFAKLGLPHISLSAFLTPYGVTHLSLLLLIIELRPTSSTKNSTNHYQKNLSWNPTSKIPMSVPSSLPPPPLFLHDCTAMKSGLCKISRRKRDIALCKIRKRYWIASHCCPLCSCPAADQLSPRLLLLLLHLSWSAITSSTPSRPEVKIQFSRKSQLMWKSKSLIIFTTVLASVFNDQMGPSECKPDVVPPF